LPQHKSAKKRLKTAEKARVRNKAVRSAIQTSIKKIRTAEKKEEIQTEIPNLFSMMDKASKNNRGNFNANKVANYKRKVHQMLSSAAA